VASEECAFFQIVNNECVGNTGYGIAIDLASDANPSGFYGSFIVKGNICSNNLKSHGIWVNMATDGIFSENICSGNGINPTNGGSGIGVSARKCLFVGNYCTGNKQYGIALFQGNYPMGDHGVVSNKLDGNMQGTISVASNIQLPSKVVEL